MTNIQPRTTSWMRNSTSRSTPGAIIDHELVGELQVPTFHEVEKAAARIKRYVRRTPVFRSAALDELAGAPVWLKAESLQVTGSFKIRGAFNALLSLPPDQLEKGVIAYSTGNHGQAIAWAARTLGVPATIVMPADAPNNKVKRALSQGARVVHYDRQRESRETIGMRLKAETGGTLIPPGDHPAVIAGQGTLALEALEDLPSEVRDNLGTFIAPCGGGGMLAGCGLVVQAQSPKSRLIAVEPAGFDDTVRSLETGQRQINTVGPKTLCDALVAVTPAELPYEINHRFLDGAVSVSDSEVADAIRFALEDLHLLVEPGGAVALAALLAGRVDLRGDSAIVVLSGGNVDLPLLAGILDT